ncbi:MAG: hypothetical protein WCR01_01365 [Bacteroidota bacterium]
MKNLTLIIAIIAVVFSGCKKKTEDPVANGNVAGNYEYIMKGQTAGAPVKYYRITLMQSGVSANGLISVHNSAAEGVVTGSVNGGVLSLSADFGQAATPFTFTGSFDPSKKPDRIGGTVTSEGIKFQATLQAIVEEDAEFNIDSICQGLLATNKYVLTKVLSAVNPTGPPVIFIHGMGGNMSNWNNTKTPNSPYNMVSQLSATFRAKHDVWLFQYNWKDSIIINGRALKDSVERNGLVNPILIGHSMGGLVARGYVASGGTITRLVTLGTPHLGTKLVDDIDCPLVCMMNFPGPRNMLPAPKGKYIQLILDSPLDIANRSKYYAIAGQITGEWESTENSSFWLWHENWYSAIDKTGYALFQLLPPVPDNDGLVPVPSGQFDGGGVNNPLPLQQWIDHFHLICPMYAPQIIDYINTL